MLDPLNSRSLSTAVTRNNSFFRHIGIIARNTKIKAEESLNCSAIQDSSQIRRASRHKISSISLARKHGDLGIYIPEFVTDGLKVKSFLKLPIPLEKANTQQYKGLTREPNTKSVPFLKTIKAVLHNSINSLGYQAEPKEIATPKLKLNSKVKLKKKEAKTREILSSNSWYFALYDSPKCDITKKAIYMLRSVYENRLATVFFNYPEYCQVPPKSQDRVKIVNCEEINTGLYYYIADIYKYPCINRIFDTAGFEETTDEDYLIYIGEVIGGSVAKDYYSYRKINHFPGSSFIGRKDTL